MATPTRGFGNTGNTVFHFFINNGQRYFGMPGYMHVPISNEIFESIKTVVTTSDIPCGELGETDTRLYGIQVRDSREIPAGVWTQGINDADNHGENPAGIVVATMSWRLLDIQQKLDALVTTVNALAGGAAPAPAPVKTYTVVAGDTLSSIAKAAGVTVADLQQWNAITDPNAISVGQVLRLGP